MKLQKEVSAKYRIKTIRPGAYDFPKYGHIDLRTITVQQADELVKKEFPFLQLREKTLEITKEKQNKIEQKEETPKPATIENSTENLRKNKGYVNKLLSMNWPDLSFQDKVIFNNSEKNFLKKKTHFITNSDMTREMRSLHAKMKSIDNAIENNNKRKEHIQKLSKLEKQITDNWQIIDTWEPAQKKTEETETERAVRLALEKEKKIKANKIYIYRAEKMISNMKENTEKQRRKKETKKQEIEKRKQELIELVNKY